MRTDRIARPRMTTRSGSPSRGASLAPGAGNSLAAGASCASSLQASLRSDDAVNCRGCCRSYAAVIAAAVVLAGAATNRLAVVVACVSGTGTDAVLDWMKQGMLLGQGKRAVARMGGRRLCDLAAVNCGRRGLLGERLLRLTYISRPCGHRLSGDEAGFDARRCEQGAMG